MDVIWMTIEQAIKQLDWYFEEDDGGAADKVTKEAYYTLKSLAQNPLFSMSLLLWKRR